MNWLVFSSVGVLPMPIWPAAALAILAAMRSGWAVAPGIAAGTILANYFSLNAPLSFAFCISVMNTIGPVLGAAIIKMRITSDLVFKNFTDIIVVLMVGIVLVPMLTALGGIGSKVLLGLLPGDMFWGAYLRWAMAHSLGTLLFALPYIIWTSGRGRA